MSLDKISALEILSKHSHAVTCGVSLLINALVDANLPPPIETFILSTLCSLSTLASSTRPTVSQDSRSRLTHGNDEQVMDHSSKYTSTAKQVGAFSKLLQSHAETHSTEKNSALHSSTPSGLVPILTSIITSLNAMADCFQPKSAIQPEATYEIHETWYPASLISLDPDTCSKWLSYLILKSTPTPPSTNVSSQGSTSSTGLRASSQVQTILSEKVLTAIFSFPPSAYRQSCLGLDPSSPTQLSSSTSTSFPSTLSQASSHSNSLTIPSITSCGAYLYSSLSSRSCISTPTFPCTAAERTYLRFIDSIVLAVKHITDASRRRQFAKSILSWCNHDLHYCTYSPSAPSASLSDASSHFPLSMSNHISPYIVLLGCLNIILTCVCDVWSVIRSDSVSYASTQLHTVFENSTTSHVKSASSPPAASSVSSSSSPSLPSSLPYCADFFLDGLAEVATLALDLSLLPLPSAKSSQQNILPSPSQSHLTSSQIQLPLADVSTSLSWQADAGLIYLISSLAQALPSSLLLSPLSSPSPPSSSSSHSITSTRRSILLCIVWRALSHPQLSIRQQAAQGVARLSSLIPISPDPLSSPSNSIHSDSLDGISPDTVLKCLTLTLGQLVNVVDVQLTSSSLLSSSPSSSSSLPSSPLASPTLIDASHASFSLPPYQHHTPSTVGRISISEIETLLSHHNLHPPILPPSPSISSSSSTSSPLSSTSGSSISSSFPSSSFPVSPHRRAAISSLSTSPLVRSLSSSTPFLSNPQIFLSTTATSSSTAVSSSSPLSSSTHPSIPPSSPFTTTNQSIEGFVLALGSLSSIIPRHNMVDWGCLSLPSPSPFSPSSSTPSSADPLFPLALSLPISSVFSLATASLLACLSHRASSIRIAASEALRTLCEPYCTASTCHHSLPLHPSSPFFSLLSLSPTSSITTSSSSHNLSHPFPRSSPSSSSSSNNTYKALYTLSLTIGKCPLESVTVLLMSRSILLSLATTWSWPSSLSSSPSVSSIKCPLDQCVSNTTNTSPSSPTPPVDHIDQLPSDAVTLFTLTTPYTLFSANSQKASPSAVQTSTTSPLPISSFNTLMPSHPTSWTELEGRLLLYESILSWIDTLLPPTPSPSHLHQRHQSLHSNSLTTPSRSSVSSPGHHNPAFPSSPALSTRSTSRTLTPLHLKSTGYPRTSNMCIGNEQEQVHQRRGSTDSVSSDSVSIRVIGGESQISTENNKNNKTTPEVTSSHGTDSVVSGLPEDDTFDDWGVETMSDQQGHDSPLMATKGDQNRDMFVKGAGESGRVGNGDNGKEEDESSDWDAEPEDADVALSQSFDGSHLSLGGNGTGTLSPSIMLKKPSGQNGRVSDSVTNCYDQSLPSSSSSSSSSSTTPVTPVLTPSTHTTTTPLHSNPLALTPHSNNHTLPTTATTPSIPTTHTSLPPSTHTHRYPLSPSRSPSINIPFGPRLLPSSSPSRHSYAGAIASPHHADTNPINKTNNFNSIDSANNNALTNSINNNTHLLSTPPVTRARGASLSMTVSPAVLFRSVIPFSAGSPSVTSPRLSTASAATVSPLYNGYPSTNSNSSTSTNIGSGSNMVNEADSPRVHIIGGHDTPVVTETHISEPSVIPPHATDGQSNDISQAIAALSSSSLSSKCPPPPPPLPPQETPLPPRNPTLYNNTPSKATTVTITTSTTTTTDHNASLIPPPSPATMSLPLVSSSITTNDLDIPTDPLLFLLNTVLSEVSQGAGSNSATVHTPSIANESSSYVMNCLLQGAIGQMPLIYTLPLSPSSSSPFSSPFSSSSLNDQFTLPQGDSRKNSVDAPYLSTIPCPSLSSLLIRMLVQTAVCCLCTLATSISHEDYDFPSPLPYTVYTCISDPSPFLTLSAPFPSLHSTFFPIPLAEVFELARIGSQTLPRLVQLLERINPSLIDTIRSVARNLVSASRLNDRQTVLILSKLLKALDGTDTPLHASHNDSDFDD